MCEFASVYLFFFSSFLLFHQRKEPYVQRVPTKAGEAQDVSEPEHAVVPAAAYAAHHEAAPAHPRHSEQDPAGPPSPQHRGNLSQDCTEGERHLVV